MLIGCLDLVERTRITGWAQETDQPDVPVRLLVTVNGVLLARVVANTYRKDLRRAGIGNGRHAFDLAIEGGLPPLSTVVVRLRREVDGADLPNSPMVYEPAPVFDELARQRLSAHLGAAETDAELEERIEFLGDQLASLQQRLSDRQGGHAQARTHRELMRRWSHRLPGGGDDPPPPPGLRALIVDDSTPNAGRDAGSSAVLSHIAAFQRLGYDVAFAPADMDRTKSPALEAAGVTVYRPPFYASVEEVLRQSGGTLDVVYLHRVTVAARYTGLVRFHCPRARLLYSVADLHHLRVARQAQQQRRPELVQTSRTLRDDELRAAHAADAVITHSSFEAALLAAQCPPGRVHLVPWCASAPPLPLPPLAGRSGVAFIGFYGHAPNRDAARWLVRDIMPLIWRRLPSLTCLLVGEDLPDDLARIRDSRVVAVGRVASLSEVFGRVRLTVAPLTWGAGLKGKVMESLAVGVPCVCTTIAAEGFDLPPELAALVADSADALADAVVSLHDDVARLQSCGEAALAFVHRDFSEHRIDQLLAGALGLDQDRHRSTASARNGYVHASA